MIPNRELEKYDCISFDVFDTLVKRNVSDPTDVFALVERYAKLHNIDCPKDFVQQRILADVRANQKKNGFANLTDIYAEINVKNKIELQKIEIQMELSTCFPNKKYVDLFNSIIGRRTVVLISDMYLSSQIITKILEKCGIKGYKKLYVSNEINKNKYSGELYKYVANKLGIKYNRMIHIGDNFKSDFLRPRLLGMKSYLVMNKKENSSGLSENVINNSISICKESLNKYEAMGCATFGPLLLGFSKWLDKSFTSDKIKTAYFLSRDGLIILKAYRELYPNKIKTQYLYGSRRAYTTPLIWKYNKFEDITKIITFQKRLTVRQFVSRLGINPDKIANEINKEGLNLDKVYENGTLFDDSKVEKLYYDLAPSIIKNSKWEFENLDKYFKQLKLEDKIALVDIGYHGTMQNSFNILMNEMNISATTKGYYVGLDSKSSFLNIGAITADGYIFRKDNDKYRKTIESFIPIFEAFFLAQHGSVQYFKEDNGIVKPVLGKYEYDDKNGMIINEKEFLYNLTSGALKFIRMFKNSLVLDTIDVSPDAAMKNIVKLGQHPSLKEANLWGDCRFLDDGVNYIAKPSKKIKRMKQEFMLCAWKIGYMKRLFKIPFPYSSVYGLLRKIFNN